jgi:putative pyruvate formate lyase activating enzyme
MAASYLNLLESGLLEQRCQELKLRLSPCRVCPWECRCDRTAGQTGICRTGERARVSSYGPHLGEENPLRGWRGSGTIFFSLCNLHCQYCQNFDISQSSVGEEVEPEELASFMLELQQAGCHNINLVSPSHVVPQIVAAVWAASRQGLHLPIVYNTGGFDSLETLKLLDGIVDIYMPDMKYANPQISQRYSKARNYPSTNQQAVREMHRQVGDLVVGENGLAQRGLLVRHLVLPNQLAGTGEVMAFLANEISLDTYVNIMDQYRPQYNARQFSKLNRPLHRQEYLDALEMARQAGLHRFEDRSVGFNKIW